MAAVLVSPTSEIIDEMHPQPKPGADEEIVDLDKPSEPPAPAPAAATPAAPAAPAPAPRAEDDVPEEYRGKTSGQLAKMLKDAQSLIGRQGGELGEFRKKADLLIEASLANLRANRQAPAAPAPAPAAPKAPEDVDFFAQPADAVAKMIEASPAIQEIRKTLGAAAAQQAEARAAAATERFNGAHPDAAEIMGDPDFQTWVKASRVRSHLLQRAHTNFDFDAGDEIFGTWKALRSVKAPATPAAPPAAPASNAVSDAARTLASARKKQALNDAAAPTSGNAAPAATGSKKIYRRADVIQLMSENPARYEQLAPEIELAYREGRVR